MQNVSLQRKFKPLRTPKTKAEVKLQAVKKSEQAHSDVGVLLLLTLILVGIGRAMGSWISNEEIRIQKAPGESVSRGEEYQKLHEQMGPHTSFRLF